MIEKKIIEQLIQIINNKIDDPVILSVTNSIYDTISLDDAFDFLVEINKGNDPLNIIIGTPRSN
jgi:hypothetical protein